MNYKRKACSQKTQRILQFYPQNSLTVTPICIIQILEKQPPPLYYALDKFLKDGKQIEKEAFLFPTTPPKLSVSCQDLMILGIWKMVLLNKQTNKRKP